MSQSYELWADAKGRLRFVEVPGMAVRPWGVLVYAAHRDGDGHVHRADFVADDTPATAMSISRASLVGDGFVSAGVHTFRHDIQGPAGLKRQVIALRAEIDTFGADPVAARTQLSAAARCLAALLQDFHGTAKTLAPLSSALIHGQSGRSSRYDF